MFHRGGVLWDTICVAFLLGIPLLPDWATVGDTLVVEVPGVVFGLNQIGRASCRERV